jgi:hypothetical protein
MDSGLAIGTLSGLAILGERYRQTDRQTERVIKKERQTDKQAREERRNTSIQSPSGWTLGWPSECCLAILGESYRQADKQKE